MICLHNFDSHATFFLLLEKLETKVTIREEAIHTVNADVVNVPSAQPPMARNTARDTAQRDNSRGTVRLCWS